MKKLFENEDNAGITKKPAISTYNTFKNSLNMKYSQFLAITRDEKALEYLIRYCYLGYPMKYFKNKDNSDRITFIARTTIDRKKALPEKIAFEQDLGKLNAIIQLESAGLDIEQFDFSNIKTAYIENLYKGIKGNDGKVDVNAFYDLHSLFKALKEKSLPEKNETQKKEAADIEDKKPVQKAETEDIKSGDNEENASENEISKDIDILNGDFEITII